MNGAAGSFPPPLVTVDADTLLSTPLPPPLFAVKDLLPQGLHILAGSPKVGKSWLVLWLCLCISMGEEVWGYGTCAGTVLYLCLEDSFQRIQNRLFQITDSAPDNLHFATFAQGLEDGVCEQIRAFVKGHSDTRLIVIDTLQRIRNGVSDGNAYANDYRDLGRLKKLADEYRMVILLVHHVRKMVDDDPFNTVSGTTGITGAVDGSFVLVKDKRNTNTAKLYITGRDIEYRELIMEFSKCRWNVNDGNKFGEEEQNTHPPIIDTVIRFVHENGDWNDTASALHERIENGGIPANMLAKLLNQYRDVLLANGIHYGYKRTNTRRTISLRRISDGSDGSDG